MFNNNSSPTDFQSYMAELKRINEQKRLAKLQQQYPATPDYTNMSLQDELQARYDIDELNQLQQKHGTLAQPPVPPMQTATVPQTAYIQSTQPELKSSLVPKALNPLEKSISAVMNREKEIITNTPQRINSLAKTVYNLVTDYDGVMNLPQDYNTSDPVSSQNSTLENMINYVKQFNIDQGERLSDVNKHQHMSCLAGRDGLVSALAGLGVATAKEGWDIIYKMANPKLREDYGGWDGILADSKKDMKNNIRGFKHGFMDNQPCYPLLKNPLK